MFRVKSGKKASRSTRRPWGWPKAYPWSVKKHRLRGGRRDGVDLIVVDNGALRFSVVPTRGMGLWKGWYDGNRLGWDSPVTDGPVHPSLVNLAAAGGLGWLDGFDELLARCGLENNGAPFEVKTVKPDGSESQHDLRPARQDRQHPRLVCGRARRERSRRTRSSSRGTSRSRACSARKSAWSPGSATVPGSNRLVVRDEFVNLKDQPVEMQILYHWNFGPPFLDAGVAVRRTDQDGDPARRAGPGGHRPARVYGGPRAWLDRAGLLLRAACRVGRRAADARHAPQPGRRQGRSSCGSATDQLPAFTLWKNTGGLRDGYVTGLEPGTNYPNARPFEKAHNRVVTLPVDGRYVAETTLEVLATAEAVAAVEAEIKQLQAQGAAKVNPKPAEPFAPEE